MSEDMSEERFSADWLQQREPFDTAARNAAAERLQPGTRLAQQRPAPGKPWRVIDLACGTGANLRWLAPHLGGAQQWLAVDHDELLLQCWPERLGLAPQALDAPLHWSGAGFEAAIVRQPLDLAAHLETLPWRAAHLVTASALLDLVSASWLQRLVAQAVGARVAMLFTLSVDGRHDWTPSDRLDATVGQLFGAHQRRDKGFGPALGAHAVPALRRALQGSGYRVFTAPSHWQIDGRDGEQAARLQAALVQGMANAAAEQDPAQAAAVAAWQQRRHAVCATARVCVGHVDVLALPPASR